LKPPQIRRILSLQLAKKEASIWSADFEGTETCYLPILLSAIRGGVKVHIAVLGVEFDHLSPPALSKQFEKVLIAKSEGMRSTLLEVVYEILS